MIVTNKDVVLRQIPTANEHLAPAGGGKPREFRIYDDNPPSRCLGWSPASFEDAWSEAAKKLASEQ
jgi:hypothetical protein